MSEIISTKPPREITFVEGLYKLADDRGAMAKLRRSLRADNQMADPAAASVLGRLLCGVHELDEKHFYLVAGLFALSQTGSMRGCKPALQGKPWDGETLGQSFRGLKQKEIAEGRAKPDKSTSLDSRFVSLLNSDPEYLPVRLRQSVKLLISNNTTIHWERLLWDLKRFGKDNREVQENWARDYWKKR